MMKTRLRLGSRIYWNQIVNSGQFYTPDTFFATPLTSYETSAAFICSGEAMNNHFFEELRGNAHDVEYGYDVNATMFNDGVPWALNSMPDCLLSQYYGNVNSHGLTTPFNYFGMGGSLSPAHVEDEKLCSINFVHRGGKKMWFFVPAEFHEAVAKLFIEDYEHCPHHLRHKSVFIEPSVLREQKIPVFEAEQAPGEFIITFPDAVHFGYNATRNQAEAVNFATTGWVPYGLACPKSKCTAKNMCGTDIPRIDALGIAKKGAKELAEKFLIGELSVPLVRTLSKDQWIDLSLQNNLGLQI